MQVVKLNAQEMLRYFYDQRPETKQVLEAARKAVPGIKIKREIAEYQAAALSVLAAPYNFPGARILEIGTALGYSAAVMAYSAPDAQIVTLNPNEREVPQARKNLSFTPNVQVVQIRSVDYLKSTPANFDFIFVDGDHKNVTDDLPYWDLLNPGGTILFHDYSPAGTYRECPPVYEAVNNFCKELGVKGPDIKIVDDGKVGMAGFYKPPRARLPIFSAERMRLARSISVNSAQYLSGLGHLGRRVQKVPGVMVECGAGGSALALYWGRNSARGKRPHIHIFDTFAGIPQPEKEDGPKALSRWQSSMGGWCKREITELQAAIGRDGGETWLSSFQFYAGDYADLQGQFEQPISLLHIDATLYRSTKQCLAYFTPVLSKGAVVVVGAYAYWPGVRQAVDEYRATLPKAPPLLSMDRSAVWWTV